MMPLVLSLFPGIGLLDMAFELEGFSVVRGPDLLWGGDIRRFHPPPGRFDGVIGGPPCQRFSRLANIVKAVHGEDALAENLIPEFERVVSEADPSWFVMENVPAAPLPRIPLYETKSTAANNRWFGGVQNRVRRFTFGSRLCFDARDMVGWMHREEVTLESAEWEPAVCSARGPAIGGSGKRKPNLRSRSVSEEAVLQGLPEDFLANAPFTTAGKRKAIGNGVPLPLGRAVARAVKHALEARRAA